MDQPLIVTRAAVVSCSILTTGVGLGVECTVSLRINPVLDSNKAVNYCLQAGGWGTNVHYRTLVEG